MTTWILRAAPPNWIAAGYPIEEIEVYGRGSRLQSGRAFRGANDDRPAMFAVCERHRTDEEAAP